MIDRYPGARPFADTPNDQRLFFGRSQEIDTLFHRICATRLLVLFGKSGLGKTSLLQAGVFPRLRERAMLPLPIRLNQKGSPLETITAFVQMVCQSAGIEYIPGEGESVWQFFKTAMFWRDDTLLTPVLVFDQFEEIFTLKQAVERTALGRELGDLFRGGVPQAVREKRRTGSGSPSLSEQPPDVKVVLSLREDHLGALQELTIDIPSIFDDRVRLAALTAVEARQAIQEPARLQGDEAAVGSFVTPPFEYTEEALADILDFLKGKSETIEPFQLQLVCRSVEKQVAHWPKQDQGNISVGRQELGGRERLETIVQNFYRQAIIRLPKQERKGARRLCEEGLLTQKGHRLILQEDQIKVEYTLSQAALDMLVEVRLLRKEPRLESFFYELSHDSLARPILDSWRNETMTGPLLFISHRHADQAIAEVLHKFFMDRSGGRIEVYQSSLAYADSPRLVGRGLNRQLRKLLWTAGVVVLVYTSPDEDWSYCMWECGVASEANIVVLQCGPRSPSGFSRSVRVNAKDPADIQKFTYAFLTSPNFFPDYGEAVAPEFYRNEDEVRQAARELHDALTEILPADAQEGEDWATVPFLRLQLTYAEVDAIRQLGKAEGSRSVQESARVADIDGEALRIFGLGRIKQFAPFSRLVEAWQQGRPDEPTKWVEELCEQIRVGGHWRRPRFGWQLMRSVDDADQTKYSPVLSRVRSVPRQRYHQFDIYFMGMAREGLGRDLVP